MRASSCHRMNASQSLNLVLCRVVRDDDEEDEDGEGKFSDRIDRESSELQILINDSRIIFLSFENHWVS